jgi:multidrug efflux pump
MPAPNVPFFTNGWTTTMNIYSQVGLVTLVGLIAKNAILIVEFANKLQEQGHDKLSAISEASRIRLRPVLMTTIATVAGHMPLIFVTGAGAKARNSIGLVLVGGMTIGTIFTLFIVPSLYMLLAKNHNEHNTDGGGDEQDINEPEHAQEPARQLEEPALARKRVEDNGGRDGHGAWQPA